MFLFILIEIIIYAQNFKLKCLKKIQFNTLIRVI